MIFTLTPNPALDVSGEVERLVPNEKNYVHDEQRDPGGNGINSARIIHRLGTPVTALGFLGGAAGQEIQERLNQEGVRTRFTRIRATSRTNVTVHRKDTGAQTRLTFPGPEIRPTEVIQLLRLFKALRGRGMLCIGGSLPRGCPGDFYARVAGLARAKGWPVIVDVPAREIDRALGGVRPFLIKPNLPELEEWSGKSLRSDSARIRAAQALAKKADLVCLSLAEKGAILVHRDGVLRGKAPKIRARGTVGAGDSMVGAMAASIWEKRPLSEVLRWGMAAGAATAQAKGTSLAPRSEIRRLYRIARVC